MQYKLVKKYWKVLLNQNALIFLFISVVYFPLSVHSETVTLPVAPYSKVTSGTTKNVYYAYTTSSSPATSSGFVDHAAGFKSIDYTTTSSSNALYFDIVTDLTETSSDEYYVGVYALASGGDETDVTRYIPISYAEKSTDSLPTTCSECTASAALPALYSFARIAGATRVRIGFFLEDICDNISDSVGCSGGNAVVPSSSITKFSLIFRIGTVSGGVLTHVSNDDETLYVNIINAMPSISCTDLANSYTPGDGFINVDMSKITGAASVVGAPTESMILLGNNGGSVAFDSGTYSSNPIRVYSSFSNSSRRLTGFTNTTDGNDNQYQISFGIRDHAGVLAFSNSCTLSNVQTSEIQGLLSEDNCFIASAVFKSKNAWPVYILRQFRDAYLMKSESGRSFVNFYYKYSPPIAKWLKTKSILSLFVAFLLLPIVLVAFLFLFPLANLFLLIPALGYFYLRKKRAYVS